MPAYPGNDLATLLYENRQGVAFAGEIVPIGTTSVAFQLRRERGASYPNGVSVEVSFAGVSGTFSADVLVADTDQLDHYVTVGTINIVGPGFVGRMELPAIYAKYIAVRNTSGPAGAAVAMTALITR